MTHRSLYFYVFIIRDLLLKLEYLFVIFTSDVMLKLSSSLYCIDFWLLAYIFLQQENKPKFMEEPDALDTSCSKSEDVKAGLQANIRLLIFHSSFIFFTPKPNSSTIKQKVKVLLSWCLFQFKTTAKICGGRLVISHVVIRLGVFLWESYSYVSQFCFGDKNGGQNMVSWNHCELIYNSDCAQF